MVATAPDTLQSPDVTSIVIVDPLPGANTMSPVPLEIVSENVSATLASASTPVALCAGTDDDSVGTSSANNQATKLESNSARHNRNGTSYPKNKHNQRQHCRWLDITATPQQANNKDAT